MTDKVRENKLRRAAHRQGLQLAKSRARDPRAIDFGRYVLRDELTTGVVFGIGVHQRFTATLDDIEAYLARPIDDRSKS
jgi:hypothetical protein